MSRSVQVSVSVSVAVPFLGMFRAAVDVVSLHVNRSTAMSTLGGLPLQWELGGDSAREMNAEANGAVAEYHDVCERAFK